MARGALVDAGVVVSVFEAAEGLNLQYARDAGGARMAFVPDALAQVGDLWNGTSFTYLQVPTSVTMLQARLAIDAAGLTSAVAAAIAGQSQFVQDSWNYATTVNRTDPVVNSLGAALGLTSAQLDHLFQQAAQLGPV
jgi:hypothetical protein